MSNLQIRETSVGPFKAKEKRFMCPHCLESVYVLMPETNEKRMRVVAAALDEHRRLCTAAPPEDARVYTVTYPRA